MQNIAYFQWCIVTCIHFMLHYAIVCTVLLNNSKERKKWNRCQPFLLLSSSPCNRLLCFSPPLPERHSSTNQCTQDIPHCTCNACCLETMNYRISSATFFFTKTTYSRGNKTEKDLKNNLLQVYFLLKTKLSVVTKLPFFLLNVS